MLADELNQLDSLTMQYETEFRRTAKEHLREYVETLTTAVPSFGSNFYICPCCKSGSGRNNHFTPAFHLYRSKSGDLHYKCHSCGIEGDIFSLVGIVNRTCDFNVERKLVADFLGIDLARRTPLSEIRISDAKVSMPPNDAKQAQLKEDARSYIASCRSHIGETDFFQRRGFTDEVIHRFYLGYDPNRRQAIIPFGSCYYMGRNVDVGMDAKGARKHYKPFGLRQPLFNMSALSNKPDEPVFIVEAPLDAMSIVQAGGSSIALGGKSTELFEKVLDIYHPACHFVLAFDNDGAGRQAQEKTIGILKARGLSFSLPLHPVFKQHKDANAILIADPAALKEAVAAEKAHLHDRSATLGSQGRAKAATIAAPKRTFHRENARKRSFEMGAR